MASRGALLAQIQQGKKLKKAQTNDRSGPQLSSSSGGGGGGGGMPGMGGMALPRPPAVPPMGRFGSNNNSSSNSNNSSSIGSVQPSAPVPAVPGGLGGLFAGGMPKLRHRTGGVNVGRTSEDGNDEPKTASAEPKTGGSRFQLPFRRNSNSNSNGNGRGAETSANASSPVAAPAHVQAPVARPPAPPAFGGLPALPGRRPSDAAARSAPPVPPNSAPAKKAPPPPPTTRKPVIARKPPNLGAGRLASQSPTASPAMGSAPDLRSTLRAAPSPVNARSSADGGEGAGGVVEESQGSVSSLAGMFGQRVRGSAPGHTRTLTGSTFTAPAAPATPPPPPPPPQNANGASGHRRTGSSLAPSHTLPLPPPPPSAAGGVPVREGRWTFHALAELPPPPPGAAAARHVYPSGRSSGSTVALDF
ncbi:hypothetical protein GGI07_005264 [Coemansia sp. Benny D115]|nr:hypothetical protein GGI07_005264 [Coemansia sp. Benny D115]